jgi:hypothetical protein
MNRKGHKSRLTSGFGVDANTQSGFEEWRGAGVFVGDDFLWWALGDDLAAVLAGFGAEV